MDIRGAERGEGQHLVILLNLAPHCDGCGTRRKTLTLGKLKRKRGL